MISRHAKSECASIERFGNESGNSGPIPNNETKTEVLGADKHQDSEAGLSLARPTEIDSTTF